LLNGVGIEAGTSTRVRAFDGLRGLAVLAVLLFHAQITGMRGGFLGVSAFFTLSGYLITSLLLDEHARSGRVSLRAFWSRRARRLLPAAYVTLAAVCVYGAIAATDDQLRALRGDVLSALFYVANWHFYFAGHSYEQLFTAPSPVLHFWSLAIEEQFYLLFPIVMVGLFALARGKRIVIGVALALGAGASVIASTLLLHSSGQSRVYYGTDTRAAELLVGAVLAVVLSRSPIDRAGPRERVALNVAGIAALATMFWWWHTVDQSSQWLYRGGFALHAILTATVIVAARVDGPLARGLAWRPIVWLGAISYALYLFHWPIYLWLSEDHSRLSLPWPRLLLAIALACALASLSYRFLEQPVRTREWPREGWAKLLAPAAALVLVGGLVAVTWSPPPSKIILTSLGDSPNAPQQPLNQKVAPPKPKRNIQPLYRKLAAGQPLHILVVGDSVGVTFGRGMELWAQQHNDAVVANIAHIYCPIGREIPAIEGTVTMPSLSSCDWTKTWENWIRWFNPDVTIVNFTIWEGASRKLPGTSDWKVPGDPALDAWQLSEYQAAVDKLSERGGHVVWLNVPCGQDFKIDPGMPLWQVDYRTIPKLIASRKLVHAFDLNNELCPGGNFKDSYGFIRDARPDGNHFSDPGAEAVAEWLMPYVLGQHPLPRYPKPAA
jgi:peptidoglycan/LPS O-acetylase OafA/YrhL